MKVEIDMTGYQPQSDIVDATAAYASRVVGADNTMAAIVKAGLVYAAAEMRLMRALIADAVRKLPPEHAEQQRKFLADRGLTIVAPENTH